MRPGERRLNISRDITTDEILLENYLHEVKALQRIEDFHMFVNVAPTPLRYCCIGVQNDCDDRITTESLHLRATVEIA
jgi:hypothetical protein